VSTWVASILPFKTVASHHSTGSPCLLKGHDRHQLHHHNNQSCLTSVWISPSNISTQQRQQQQQQHRHSPGHINLQEENTKDKFQLTYSIISIDTHCNQDTHSKRPIFFFSNLPGSFTLKEAFPEAFFSSLSLESRKKKKKKEEEEDYVLYLEVYVYEGIAAVGVSLCEKENTKSRSTPSTHSTHSLYIDV